jgi:hypothetical protein
MTIGSAIPNANDRNDKAALSMTQTKRKNQRPPEPKPAGPHQKTARIRPWIGTLI